MSNKTTFILVTLFAILEITSCRRTTIKIPDEFVETIPPKYGSSEWHILNQSMNEFGVSIINGKLEIKEVSEIDECELKLSNGTLVGLDRGEWGGQLNFKPIDKTKKTVEIKKGNIKFIFNFKDKIYFIEGLAHLSISKGALFSLDTSNNSFSYNKLIDFEDAPEACTIYKDNILIASHENFYVIKDFKKELVFKETFWSSLYPNSIAVVDNKNVFLGIRSGIVSLDLATKTMKFYKYNN